MLLVGRQEGHPACKKTEWWGAGMVIYLERDADLHMAQLMPMLLTVSCFIKIHIGFTFLVSSHPGSPGQRAVKRVCMCVCVCSVLFCSLAILDPRVGHTMDVLSPFIPVLCHSDSFIHIRLLRTVKPQLYTKIKQSACLKYIIVNTYFGTTF